MFISLTYNNKNKNITYLTKPFEQKLIKRFSGTKKVAEEVSKKCIGAGCASTRPFMNRTLTSTPNPIEETSPTVTPEASKSKFKVQEETSTTPPPKKFLSHNDDAAPLTTKANQMPDVTSKDISEESSLAKLERKIPSILDKKNGRTT